MREKFTTENLLIKFKEIHGEKYDYSEFIYNGYKEKISIICKHHGLYKVSVYSHLSGQNCKKCMYEGGRHLPFTLNKEKFIEKSNKTHEYKYNYDKVIYKTNKDVVIIECPIHGEYMQRPDQHMQGAGCIKCSGTYQYTKEDFEEKSIKKHGERYDYSKADYINNDSKIIIICPLHGEFKQTAKDHLNGCGCIKCSLSKGEISINNFLNSNNFIFESQKKFNDCKGGFNLKLKFDFYLPYHNLCIEYDGEQHFKPQRFRGISKQKSLINFDRLTVNDQIKNKYCQNNSIELLRIPYTEFKNIGKILETWLLKNQKPRIVYPQIAV